MGIVTGSTVDRRAPTPLYVSRFHLVQHPGKVSPGKRGQMNDWREWGEQAPESAYRFFVSSYEEDELAEFGASCDYPVLQEAIRKLLEGKQVQITIKDDD